MDNVESLPVEKHPEPIMDEATRRQNRAAMFIVFLVVFIDLLGFGIVLPLLPLYASELLEPLFPGNQPVQGMMLGLLMSSFSVMQFIFAPIWGRVSDRVGRRKILLLGLGASVTFYAMFGIASEVGAAGHLIEALVLLFVARMGAGIAGATISTAQAVIADCTTKEKRSHGMALIGAAFGIGFTFGPLLGFASLFLPYHGAPGYVAAAFSLIALLLAVRLMPETLRTGAEASRRRWFDWQGFKNTLQTPTVGMLVLTFFLATFAFGGLESTLALVNKFMLDPVANLREMPTPEAMTKTHKQNFLVFAYVGLVLTLTQGLFYRRLIKRFGEVMFMRFGILLMAVGLGGAIGVLLELVAYPACRDGSAIWIAALGVMTLAVIGFACLTPSVQALISSRSDPAKQGEILGVNQSASAMARILGPMISLSLFNLTESHTLPYIFGTALLAIVFVVTLQLRQD